MESSSSEPKHVQLLEQSRICPHICFKLSTGLPLPLTRTEFAPRQKINYGVWSLRPYHRVRPYWICHWWWVFGQHHGSHWRLIHVGIKGAPQHREPPSELCWQPKCGAGAQVQPWGGSCREASEKETPEGSPSAYTHILGCARKLRAHGTCSEEASDELLTNFNKRCLQLDSGKPDAQLCHKHPGKMAADTHGQWAPPSSSECNELGHMPTSRTPQCKKKREVFIKGKW